MEPEGGPDGTEPSPHRRQNGGHRRGRRARRSPTVSPETRLLASIRYGRPPGTGQGVPVIPEAEAEMRKTWSVRRGACATALVFGIVMAIGCGEHVQGPSESGVALDQAAVPGGTPSAWDLPLRGDGQLARAFPGTPCDTPLHRQFDFWVGEWNVTNVNDVQIGTNIVTSELDGCLVQEHWTASGGSRGLSLNTYDGETGQWHQTWVSQDPRGVFGRLRTAGGFEGGMMVLEGERDAALGFTFLDTWTWEENAEGQVIQTALAEVPELSFRAPFTGIYTRGVVSPAAPSVTHFCDEGQIGGALRLADFIVGSWEVAAPDGTPLGTADISSELSDCLFVEEFESRGGLRAISFTYVDRWDFQWYRTYVDSEGERLELAGGFENGALVLRGTEGSPGGAVEVIVTWQPKGSGFVQTWDVSRDGGATFERTATLLYAAT